MIETLILSAILGILGGMLGCSIILKSMSKIIEMDAGYIRYIKSKDTDYITVTDKNNKAIIDVGIKKTINGIDYIKYGYEV